jgi:prepilin signal peptidase PulO-like enzyme (type II secretory pathway)
MPDILLTLCPVWVLASEVVEPLTVWPQWLLGLWLLALGACVGSFMNVVIYRLPAGMSIVHPGSRCPKCAHPIRGYDNIPVISWLLLRGRCRDCGDPISARYPAVEALAASVFVGLAIVEVFSGVGNWPVDGPFNLRAWDIEQAPAIVWAVYACHVVLLSTLICGALIEYDGKRIPARLFLPALILGVALPFVLPQLALSSPRTADSAGAIARQLIDLMTSLGAGAVLGLCTFPATSRRPPGVIAAVAELALCGLCLGFRVAAVLTCVAAASYLLLTIVGRVFPSGRIIPWSACLAVAAGSLIIGWRALAEQLPWLVRADRWTLFLLAAATVVLVSFASQRIRQLRRTSVPACPNNKD